MSNHNRKKPNPQGKGQSSSVGYLVATTASITLPSIWDDSHETIVEDYLNSLLVISCEFKFCPVRDTDYYIYSQRGKLILSMISPEEGGGDIFDESLAKCRLKNDFSWKVSRFEKKKLGVRLSTAKPDADTGEDMFSEILEDIEKGKLGRYNTGLGYYQNVLNFVLGKSITLRSRQLLEIENGCVSNALSLSESSGNGG